MGDILAFESLSEKISAAFKKLKSKGKLTESDVKSSMREVRMALLEADVNYKIVSENGTTWSGNIGLIAHSDYLRANSDMANCGTDKTNYENYEICRNTDWMYISGSYWWTISPHDDFYDIVWNVYDDGKLEGNIANGSAIAPRPAAYLKSDITLSGSGTSLDPYKIVS